MGDNCSDAQTGRRRIPRKATAESLERAAPHYLGRYASSAASLRRVVRSARFHGTDADAGAAIVDGLVERFSSAGLLDDARFAEGRALSLVERGVAPRAVRMRLREKGVADAVIEATLAALADDRGDIELSAVVALARRRRLGPFCDRDRAARCDKDLATLARPGFSYDVALRVIDAENRTDLDHPGSDFASR